MLNLTRVLPRVLQLQAFLPVPFRYYSQYSNMNADVDRILSFWFDGPDTMEKWFFPKPGFDEEIQEKFGDLMRQARTTELDSWEDQPKSTLSLLILTDQFPRNVWRNTPDAFSSDHKALDIASRAVIKGFDREVTPFQQLFFYLPFVHSESTTSQVAAMALFEGAIKRIDDPESEEAKLLNRSLGFAKGHAVPIAKFGRFPSRNVALGRETTKEEEEFLKEHPSGF